MPVGLGNEHAFDMRVFIHIGRIFLAIEKGEYIVGQVAIRQAQATEAGKIKSEPGCLLDQLGSNHGVSIN